MIDNRNICIHYDVCSCVCYTSLVNMLLFVTTYDKFLSSVTLLVKYPMRLTVLSYMTIPNKHPTPKKSPTRNTPSIILGNGVQSTPQLVTCLVDYINLNLPVLQTCWGGSRTYTAIGGIAILFHFYTIE